MSIRSRLYLPVISFPTAPGGWQAVLFPERRIYRRQLSPLRLGALFVLCTALLSAAATFLPADGWIGFDWVHFFRDANPPAFYPPWTKYVSLLTWPLLVGMTLAALGLAAFLRARRPLNLLFVFLSLPVLWTVFLGQVDGLALLGLLAMPYTPFLVLMKPQVALFACAARKQYLLSILVFFLFSLVVWGPWPQQLFSVWQVHAEGRYANDIALGLWGLPLAAVLAWFSRGDADMLLLAGACCTPYLLPYHLVVAVPALARLSPRAAGLACLLSWLPLSANWLGPGGWWAGWLFVAWVWGCLAWERYGTGRAALCGPQ
jgi:hypothetical protein